MDDNKNVILAAKVIVFVVLAPIVVNVGINIIDKSTSFIGHLSQKRAYNNRIKKGLKDGSIVIIDGQYFEVQMNVEEA